MKKVLLLMSLSTSIALNAQNLTIPDLNFRNALINTFCVDTNADNIRDADVDSNNDGQIQLAEAQAITNLFVSGRQIDNLSGIENFVNLAYLYCGINELTNLDVSALSNLISLDCGNNQLSNLNVSAQTHLVSLNCTNNQLLNLNLSALNSLASMNCSNNQLTSLDFSASNNLGSLNCSNNQLSSLHLDYCAHLATFLCNTNPLTSLYIKNGSLEATVLNFSQCPDLTYICCDANQIADVQTKVTQYGLVNCVINADCVVLDNGYLATSHELNVFPNPTDGLLNIATDLSLNHVDIYDINGRLIPSQQINTNQVDVKSLESGVYFLRLYGIDRVYYSKFVKQ